MATSKSITIGYLSTVQRNLRNKLNAQAIMSRPSKYAIATREEDLEILERAIFIVESEEEDKC